MTFVLAVKTMSAEEGMHSAVQTSVWYAGGGETHLRVRVLPLGVVATSLGFLSATKQQLQEHGFA
jgi:hypothetical protein